MLTKFVSRNFLKLAIYTGLVSLTFLGSASHLEAAPSRTPDLGSTFGQVLMLWGQPSQKVVKELKKEIVWVYPEANLVFKQGRLDAVVLGQNQGINQAMNSASRSARELFLESQARLSRKERMARREEKLKQKTTTELLSEIINELPPE